MNTLVLRQSLVISFLAHAAVVSSIGFFLFPCSQELRRPRLYFLSAVLPAAQVEPRQSAHTVGPPRILAQKKADLFKGITRSESLLMPRVYVKPHHGKGIEDSKTTAARTQPAAVLPKKRKDSSIMFHPLLPYQLQLYFKDRQAVHIELQFKIEPGMGRRSIAIRRKISSGNLEADLLSIRYMQHYLFIQKARFSPDTWQTVKIDMTTKND